MKYYGWADKTSRAGRYIFKRLHCDKCNTEIKRMKLLGVIIYYCPYCTQPRKKRLYKRLDKKYLKHKDERRKIKVPAKEFLKTLPTIRR